MTPRLALLSALLAVASSAAATENLLVFVGEKISVEEFDPPRDPNVVLTDEAFHAKYRVLDVVYGLAPGEVVAFDAYDAHGTPEFAKYQHVLLFVSKDGDRWVHQKYQFYPVFRTKSGVWAGCGAPWRYSSDPRTIQPRPLDFGSEAHFDLAGLTREDIAELYPRAYFRTLNGKAYCRQGNPVEELFEVKKQGVLKARGLFRDAPPPTL